MNEQTSDLAVIHIKPTTPWGFPDLKELYLYKDLLFFMVWRGIKVSYAQSIGGYAWALVLSSGKARAGSGRNRALPGLDRARRGGYRP